MDRLRDLSRLIALHAPREGINRSAIERLSLLRSDAPSIPSPAVYEASLCLIAQGSKRVSLGDESVVYDASSYLLVSVDLPVVGHVLEASAEEPYLCCKLDLDRVALADLILATPSPAPTSDRPALATYPIDPDLVDCLHRLVRLLEQPSSVPVLAPLIEREIAYRLLTGPHGPTLRRVVSGDGHLGQVSRAVGWIRERFRDHLRVADVAASAGMSVSSLHAHFRAITHMSPIEFQKHLRLQEARRLMLTEGHSAGAASFAVGYESPSQFSREYRRLFGAPPRRDVERIRSRAPDAASDVGRVQLGPPGDRQPSGWR